MLRLFARSAAEHVTVSFDPNVRPLLMGDREDVLARVDELLEFADVVKVSAEDRPEAAPRRHAAGRGS